MQFDPLRAFPYPVLRPRSEDYMDCAIQTLVELEPSADNQSIKAVVKLDVSVPELVQLIIEEKAVYSAVFACRNTYYRKAISSSNNVFSEVFAAGSLRDQVMIYPYIAATQTITGFTSPLINPEFGDGPFSFPLGAALAVDEPQAVFVERDAFQPISSCFFLVANENLPSHQWQLNLEEDNVHIALHPNLKARIDNARNNPQNRAMLLNSIYFAAVVQCLTTLKEKDESVRERRWANVFTQRLADQNLDLAAHQEIWLAQQLMHSPVAVMDTHFFAGDMP